MATNYRTIPDLTPQEIERFWSKVDKTPGHGPRGECWLWNGLRNNYGYGLFTFRNIKLRAHRVAYRLTTGIDPGTLEVCHKCDTPSCVRCLFIGTRLENARDAMVKNRTSKGDRHRLALAGKMASGDKHGLALHPEARPRGESHGNAILTERSVREIRERAKCGELRSRIAASLGLKASLIGKIVRRDSWKHV